MTAILEKNWKIQPALSDQASRALAAYPPVLRQILFNRGVATPEAAQQYLEAAPPPGAEPLALLGMAAAVERIRFAIERNETIVVYGDYDTDGVTATALLTETLRALGAQARGYIPNRFEEGYGLNSEALSSLQAEGVKLVITVDCGIRSQPEAEHAQKLGLDLIITDHHQPAETLPPALAIINPKQPGDGYPDKDLAGVGVAYKLAQALFNVERSQGNVRRLTLNVDAETFLDLVALGTVADLAPLVGENRSLVRAGLEYLRRPHRQGVMSLIGAAGLNPERIGAMEIGFALGPRLNAAGRLESALAAYDLLTTRDVQTAGALAQQLNNHNRARQEITREIQGRAEQIALAGQDKAMILFAADSSFNRGVVGLAASHLVEKYYRPAIVAEVMEEYTRGSCRSIPEFHITEALDRCADLLEHHGGHAAAAGFTVRNDRLPTFVERIQAIAQETLGSLDLRPTLLADAEIPLAELTGELYRWLARMQPTGYGNPQATLVTRKLKVRNAKLVGKDSSHLKLTVSDGRMLFDAIAFRQGHWMGRMPAEIDLLYNFETNEYNGRVSYQLNVRDIKASSTSNVER